MHGLVMRHVSGPLAGFAFGVAPCWLGSNYQGPGLSSLMDISDGLFISVSICGLIDLSICSGRCQLEGVVFSMAYNSTPNLTHGICQSCVDNPSVGADNGVLHGPHANYDRGGWRGLTDNYILCLSICI